MHLVYIKVQSLMPKVQSQSQKSEALFKLVWTTVRPTSANITSHNIMQRKVATDRVLQFKIKKHNIMLTNIMR